MCSKDQWSFRVPLNDQPSQTALQPVSDESVVITALLWGRTPSGTLLRRKSLFLQGSRTFMQNCVTNSFSPLSFLDGDEINWTNTVCHMLSTGPEGSPLMLLLLSAKTTSLICAHSPVFLTGNVLTLFPDCWPSEVRRVFIVTESKWILIKFTILPIYSGTNGLNMGQYFLCFHYSLI